jgi:hypothetical protein
MQISFNVRSSNTSRHLLILADSQWMPTEGFSQLRRCSFQSINFEGLVKDLFPRVYTSQFSSVMYFAQTKWQNYYE